MKPVYWTCAALLLSGCTTVHVHPMGDATVQTSNHLGLARITLDLGRRGSIVYRSTGVGAASTLTGVSVGFWSETTALLSADGECRVVIWADSAEQVARIERMLRAEGQSLSTVCIVKSGASP